MSAAEATRFLSHVETDTALSERLAALASDPAAVHAAVRAAGFDCTPAELKDAFLEAHGSELTAEQLDAVAGGIDSAAAGILAGGAIFGGMVAASAGAAA